MDRNRRKRREREKNLKVLRFIDGSLDYIRLLFFLVERTSSIFINVCCSCGVEDNNKGNENSIRETLNAVKFISFYILIPLGKENEILVGLFFCEISIINGKG